MLKTKNSLNQVIFKYFLIFSFFIVLILWTFQIFFFSSFYRTQKTNDIKIVADKIKKNNSLDNFEEYVNDLAFDKGVCIEMTDRNYDLLYGSAYFGKGCISGIERTYQYKYDFISNNKESATYEITNPKFHNSTLVQALKLSNNQYVFINTSLEPVDGITTLIHKQLIVITGIILILSYVVAYFISNHIAKPIKEINQQAKNLAKGNYQVSFQSSSKIQEIEELSNTLTLTKDELEKIEELRRDLMANVSHDLKTPLTMIKAYAEIAKDLHLKHPDKQEEDMNTIIHETDRLTLLVDDILTLSKMEANKDELKLEKFNLITLIEDILNQYNVLKETEHYTFRFIHKENEILIKADKKKLQQVIYNLLNNAINYTGDDNLVIIKVHCKNNILVEIIDTGNGIKESDIPYIWDKYYKNKKKHKRNLVGTGLGLGIVKKILEEHQYPYGVKTKKGKGTTFYFEIPKEEE